MPKINKKNIQRLIKKNIHKKIKRTNNNNNNSETYNHNGYYQNLYSKYLRDSAKESLVARENYRNHDLDKVKRVLNKFNNNPDLLKDNKFKNQYNYVNSLYSAYENQKDFDHQRALDLNVGNSLANPIAKNLREQDDQHLFGDQLYINSAKPNYEELAKQVTQTRIKNANKDMLYSTKETLDNILLTMLNNINRPKK